MVAFYTNIRVHINIKRFIPAEHCVCKSHAFIKRCAIYTREPALRHKRTHTQEKTHIDQ